MSSLSYILFFTFFASILSLFLVGILLFKRDLVHKMSFSLVAFAAGALLATAFLDTFKEAVQKGGDSVFLWVTLSIAGFFIIERVFLFLHHHDDDEEHAESLKMPAGFLLFGDGLHNFIDGASIAASFLVSVPIGIITSFTIFIHEIPHELGDFGILLHKGWEPKKVLLFNVATGLTAVVGALVSYYLGHYFKDAIPVLLSITTGNFIYLSATDLLPEIHHHSTKHPGWKHSAYFLAGILLIYLMVSFFHE